MTKKRPKDYVPLPPGRPAKYPWARWLNGTEHLILPGADFDGTLESMRQQVYTHARKKGIVVEIRRYGTGLAIRANVSAVRTEGGVKYDWDKLLDGHVHVLQVGRDISSTAESFRQYARRQAAERGGRITSRLVGNTLTMQAKFPPPPKPDLSDLPFEVEGLS